MTRSALPGNTGEKFRQTMYGAERFGIENCRQRIGDPLDRRLGLAHFISDENRADARVAEWQDLPRYWKNGKKT